MEMFDRSYQAVLERWSAGEMDEESFLRRTHWYANWRFDYGLYRDILAYVRDHRLRMAALNLPFSIPPKIRVGGSEHLSDDEKGFLPLDIDTTVSAHRDYAEKIFRMHEFKSHVSFEDFYLAQCVWEDIMAETANNNMKDGIMAVIAGNVHVLRCGIPGRAFARNSIPHRIIYLAPVGTVADMSHIDYIWVTP